MRVFSLAVLTAVAVGAVGGTTVVATSDGSRLIPATEASPGNQRLVGIHHLSLKEGVTPEAFERFVAEEYNAVQRDRIPGIRFMIMKGERNASDGEYLLVIEVQSVDVRDWYWPTPDSTSGVLTTLTEACGEPCSRLTEKFDSMAEDTGYADYVEIARD